MNSIMFVATKCFLPPQPPGAVTREPLYAALDEAWAGRNRLLLLSAPPGYGKTTLLSGWIAARSIPHAWVSLDADDDDPGRFFLLLLHALDRFFPGLNELTPILSVPQVTHFDSLLVEVVNRIAQSDATALLVLDDYHVIRAEGIHTLMQRLLDSLPPQLRVAVLTREDPPFALGRLRARRQMHEVRARELTFSHEESFQLLVENLGLPLDSAQVAVLVERTEGWAAGLQLAGLTLRGREQPQAVIESFSGSHRFVLDYLAGEMLDQLAPDLRDFLCRSAVLDRFSADLCDAALDISGSQTYLARAKAANLFLIALDDEHTWFRYHHLMADILKADVDSSDRRAICRRAASWWHALGHPVEAVRYAIEAQDYPTACAVIREAAIPAAENGLLATVLAWIDALPQPVLLAEPDLCVYRAWFLLFNGRFRETADWLAQTASLLPDLPRPLAGLMLAMQAWMRSVAAKALDLEQLKSAYAMTEGRFPYFSPLLLLAIGQAQREACDHEDAQRSFEEGARLAEGSSGAVSASIIRNNLAFLLNETGRRMAAMELCRESIERFSGPDGRPGLLAGIPMLAAGIFQYESGELDEAYAALTHSVNMVRRLGMYDILANPAVYNLQLLLADLGRFDEALALNKDAMRKAQKAGLALVVNEAGAVAARIHLQAGDARPAAQWVKTHPLAETHPVPQLSTNLLLHARLFSAQGQGEQAVALLEPVAALNRQAGRLLTWVRASVELGMTYLSAGKTRQALEVLQPAAAFAESQNYVQVFRANAAALAPAASCLPHALLPQTPTSAPKPGPSPALVEALTGRETEVLRLVAAGLSNAEIAEQLYLTTGTVKWFLNQVFGKLGVSRRTEAVAKAQAVGLL